MVIVGMQPLHNSDGIVTKHAEAHEDCLDEQNQCPVELYAKRIKIHKMCQELITSTAFEMSGHHHLWLGLLGKRHCCIGNKSLEVNLKSRLFCLEQQGCAPVGCWNPLRRGHRLISQSASDES
ncbi:unnamed protein product, partial [Musa textilis]